MRIIRQTQDLQCFRKHCKAGAIHVVFHGVFCRSQNSQFYIEVACSYTRRMLYAAFQSAAENDGHLAFWRKTRRIRLVDIAGVSEYAAYETQRKNIM